MRAEETYTGLDEAEAESLWHKAPWTHVGDRREVPQRALPSAVSSWLIQVWISFAWPKQLTAPSFALARPSLSQSEKWKEIRRDWDGQARLCAKAIDKKDYYHFLGRGIKGMTKIIMIIS